MQQLSPGNQIRLRTTGLLIIGCLVLSWSSGAAAHRPNILFIMSDDHAYQAVSAYGHGLNQTPNIDRIAREGVRFLQSFCTNAICAPSRAVLLTGKHSHMNGHITNETRFDGNQVTFPKLLQRAGYQTALIGKWHLRSEPTGFDYWNILPGQGDYYNPDFIEMGQRRRVEGYVTDLITEQALQWMKKRDPERPFCLLVHHKAPHRNWMPAPRHLPLLRETALPLPETLFDDYATRSEAARTQEMEIGRHLYLNYDLKVPLSETDTIGTDRDREGENMWQAAYQRISPEERAAWDLAYGPGNEAIRKAGLTGREMVEWRYQRYLKDYLRCIAAVDESVGRILEYLDQSGLAANTVVVYTSDQGFYLGEHGWFDKRFMYEESMRIPLLVRFPEEIMPMVNQKDLVMNLDFAPTFLDYAGLEIPSEMQGKSLRPVLRGRTPASWRRAVYYHYYEYPAVHSVKRHYGIRTQRFKLIHFYYDIDAWELFDLLEDPRELKNLAEDPAHGAILQSLKEQLDNVRR